MSDFWRVQVPPRAPEKGNPQSVEIAGFSCIINAFRVFTGKKPLTIVNALLRKYREK
nr:MAG TPA: hypothetical protein [Caudoviricetes sp.]